MQGNPGTASHSHNFTKPLSHVIESQQFDRELLAKLFEVAEEMEGVERGSPAAETLKGYIMATMFYEPSTRTRLSFESAMSRLGGYVLTTENAREFSSASKGETLEGESSPPDEEGPPELVICW
jgi:aspartate carbamoyltransferase catalytic subunit